MIRVYTKVKGEKILNHLLTNNISIHKDTLDFNDKTPIVFRGMARSPFIKECLKNNICVYIFICIINLNFDSIFLIHF